MNTGLDVTPFSYPLPRGIRRKKKVNHKIKPAKEAWEGGWLA